MDIKNVHIKNHEQTAHAPSTLEKIRKVKQGVNSQNRQRHLVQPTAG